MRMRATEGRTMAEVAFFFPNSGIERFLRGTTFNNTERPI